MKQRLFHILFLTSIFFLEASAQSPDNTSYLMQQTKAMILPSPEAQAFSKYGDIQVNLSAGTPNISVPFFNWKNVKGNLNLSLGLSYNASGYRVDENASFVGLGWSLDGYGMVSRAVRGLPDDLAIYGFLNRPVLPALSNYEYYNHRDQDYEWSLDIHGNPIYPNSDILISKGSGDDNYDAAMGVFKREFDGEQDIYSVNMNGLSNKFVIEKGWNVVLLTNSSIKIQILREAIQNTASYTITGFKVTDQAGLIYLFQAMEKTQVSSSSTTFVKNIDNTPVEAGTSPYVSSWYINKIQTPFTEEEIAFTYSTSLIKYPPTFSESIDYYNGDNVNTSWQEFIEEKSRTITTSNMTIWAQRLSNIHLPDNTNIDLVYNTTYRSDLKNDKSLKELTITNNAVSKKFSLTYEYFNCVSGYSAFFVGSSTDFDVTKKLQLVSVQESSNYTSNNIQKPPYKFTYNSTPIPGTNSKSLDYWGYYLGPYEPAVTTIAKLFANVGTIADPYQLLLSGTNRTPIENYVKAGVLQKIEYPTGGSTTLDLEANRAGSGSYSYTFSNGSLTLTRTQNDYIKSLDFPEPRISEKVSFDVSIVQTPTTDVPFFDCNIDLVILGLSGQQVVFTNTHTFNYNSLKDGHVYFDVDLPLGNSYVFKQFYTNCFNAMPASYSYLMTVAYQYQLNTNGQLAGGLRVKKITDFDPVSGNTLIKEYEYLAGDGITSSGKIQIVPNFDYYRSIEGFMVPVGTSSEVYRYNHYLNRSSSTNIPISSFSSSGIIYQRVVEKRKNLSGASLGRTEYTFLPNDGSGFENFYPYPDGQNYDWRRGLPLTEMVFEGTTTLKKKTIHEYTFHLEKKDNDQNRSLKSGLITKDYQGVSTKQFYCVLDMYPFTGRAEKTKTTEYVYENNIEQKTETTYGYSTDKYVLKTITTTNTKGQTLEIDYYYPQDYNSSLSLANALVTKNLVGSPLSVETWLYQGGVKKLLKASVEEPENFGNGTYTKNLIQFKSSVPVSETEVGNFNPATFLRNSNFFKTEAEILTYNEVGMPKEFRAKDDKLTTLLWDNDKKFVFVQAVNASSIEIATTSFEGNNTGNFTYAGIPVTGGLTGTKSYNLSNGNINKLLQFYHTRPYILSYWTKNSSSFTVEGTTGVPGRSYNGWTYYEHAIPASVNSVTISGTGLIDEVRLYPVTAQLTTYTYEPLKGMTSLCDLNNRISYYEYDLLGRLMLVRDLDGNILKKIEYAYQSDKETASTSSNCGGGCPSGGSSDPAIDKKCINGFCETGKRINTSIVFTSGGRWKCNYKYRFSNETLSNSNQHETKDFPCDLDQ